MIVNIMRKSPNQIKGVIKLIACCLILLIGGGILSDNYITYRIKDEVEIAIGECSNEGQYLDLVRDFAYERFEMSLDETTKIDAEYYLFKDLRLFYKARILDMCELDTIQTVGWCGGTAYTLSTLYNILGYNSCCLDLAVFEDDGKYVNSHVVTLVELDGQWIVEDSYFNLTYVIDGEHVDAIELINKVKEHDAEDISIDYGKSIYKGAITQNENYEKVYPEYYEEDSVNCDMGYLYKYNNKPECYNGFLDIEAFDRENLDKNIISYFAYPYDVYIPLNAKENQIEEFKNELFKTGDE